MARRLVDASSRQSAPTGEGRAVIVEECALADAATLVTIGPTHNVWDAIASGEPVRFEIIRSGSIARVIPPVDAERQHIELVEQALSMLGACAVKTLPQPKRSVVRQVEESDRPSGARAVIEELVKQANTRDRKALSAVVEQAMSRAGL